MLRDDIPKLGLDHQELDDDTDGHCRGSGVDDSGTNALIVAASVVGPETAHIQTRFRHTEAQMGQDSRPLYNTLIHTYINVIAVERSTANLGVIIFGRYTECRIPGVYC